MGKPDFNAWSSLTAGQKQILQGSGRPAQQLHLGLGLPMAWPEALLAARLLRIQGQLPERPRGLGPAETQQTPAGWSATQGADALAAQLLGSGSWRADGRTQGRWAEAQSCQRVQRSWSIQPRQSSWGAGCGEGPAAGT